MRSEWKLVLGVAVFVGAVMLFVCWCNAMHIFKWVTKVSKRSIYGSKKKEMRKEDFMARMKAERKATEEETTELPFDEEVPKDVDDIDFELPDDGKDNDGNPIPDVEHDNTCPPANTLSTER